jgi:hypothetical protein
LQEAFDSPSLSIEFLLDAADEQGLAVGHLFPHS